MESATKRKGFELHRHRVGAVYFMVFGEVFWLMGLVMIAGQLIGAFFGAKMALEKGSALIRPIVVIVCFVMSANILFKQFS